MLRTTVATTLTLTVLLSSPAMADHGNPWAGPDDEVRSQYHDGNQVKSAGTPGEDEMRGDRALDASDGRRGDNAGASGSRSGGGQSSGAGGRDGGQGSGGRGNGGRGNGGQGRNGN